MPGRNQDAAERIHEIFGALPVYSEADYENLSEPERFVWDVFWFREQIDNGGVDQFFYNCSGAHAIQTATALERIGAHRSAALIRSGCALFPDGLPSTDDDERRRQLEAIRLPEPEDRFEHLGISWGWSDAYDWVVDGVREDVYELLLRYWNAIT